MVQDIKAEARGIGREIEVFSSARSLPADPEGGRGLLPHAIIDNADWGSVDRMMEIKNLTPQTLGQKVFEEKRDYLPRARSAAIRSSARRTASPTSSPP